MKLILRKVGKKRDFPGRIFWERRIDGHYIGFGELHYYWRCLEHGALEKWPQNVEWLLSNSGFNHYET